MDAVRAHSRLIDWLSLLIGLGLGFEGIAWSIPFAAFVGGGLFTLALTGFHERAYRGK